MSPLSQLGDADPAPSISVDPPPTDAELVAIVAALSLSLLAQPEGSGDRVTVPARSRWAEAGRREAMPANGALPLSREREMGSAG